LHPYLFFFFDLESTKERKHAIFIFLMQVLFSKTETAVENKFVCVVCVCVCVCVLLGFAFRALCLLGKCLLLKPHPQSFLFQLFV
jgi:hypothetical protein